MPLLSMSEAELLRAVRDLARMRGWLTYHTHRSDRSEPGFPDLVCVHPRTGQLLVIELKSSSGRITADQRKWLDALGAAGVDARVFRPADLQAGRVVAALTPSDMPARSAP